MARWVSVPAQLHQFQGPLANENSRFVQDVLRQLAACQADEEYASRKAALTGKQEAELRAVEEELEQLNFVASQMLQDGGRAQIEAAVLPVPPDGSVTDTFSGGDDQTTAQLGVLTERQMKGGVEGEISEGIGNNEEPDSANQRVAQPNGSHDSLTRWNETHAPDGEEELSPSPVPPYTPSSSEPAAAERRMQLQLEVAGPSVEEVQAHLVQHYEQRMQQAEEEKARERLVQDQRTQQLLHERRQRLLEKKALLEAEQQKQLRELEQERHIKMERMLQELQQDLVDFSIEFEVEPHELDKLSRQLWNDSHQRHQQQLRDLEKRHSQAMEIAYENFLKDWALRHNGDVEASFPMMTAASIVGTHFPQASSTGTGKI